MREIKFRAWHVTEKKMYEWLPIEGLQDFGSLWNLLNGDLWQYKIMQYTGLKDRNGKEIYEDDIVRIKMGDSWQRDNSVVEWFAETCSYYPWSIAHGASDRYYSITEFELVGNKYENPELQKYRGIE